VITLFYDDKSANLGTITVVGVGKMKGSFLYFLCLLVVASSLVLADGTVTGEGRFERIKGRPGDYVELYEWDLYLSPDGGTTLGQSRRLGAEGGGGYYSIDAPAGMYTILVTQPIFFARPKVVRDVQVVDGQVSVVNPELNLDYSCYHMGDGEWTEFNSPWFQTFVATGTSINRIQFRIPGWNCSSIAVSVHESNGGNILTWPQVGPTKTVSPGYGDLWVGYRSGEVPTTPGKTYAIKLTGLGSNPNFAIYRRIEDGHGYAQGQAYDANGNPRNMDLLICVFSDNDGTIIPYIDTTIGNVEDLAGTAHTWGQTFRATGVALAAVDCFIAASTWDIDVTFRIREGGPNGPQVGPTKTAQALYQASTCGLVGVSYAPGEVMLTPGNTYYIEMTSPDSPTFAAYKFHSQADNGYPYGDAYKDGVRQQNVDLEMTIIEYVPWWSASIVNPSFEDGGGSLKGWNITLLGGEGPDDPPLDNTNPYGPRTPFGEHFAGKITSWLKMNFRFGQIIEVANYDPTSTRVDWLLSAYVNLHSHHYSDETPGNVHQIWEVGWNNDASPPPSVDRCDNYMTAAHIDGNYTSNDSHNFYPLSSSGSITGVRGLKYLTIRVHAYNDYPVEWSFNNFDNVIFKAGVPEFAPPGFYKIGWNLTSIPLQPYDPEPSAVFRDLVELGNVIDGNLYCYEPGTGYLLYPLDFSSINLGQGYWLYLTEASDETMVGVAGDTPTDDVYIPLAEGWNLIGHPFLQNVPLSDCCLTDGQSTLSFEDAVGAGWVMDTLYYYDPDSGYKTVRMGSNGDDDTLRPWYGYWILSTEAGLQLIIPKL